jgi:hypothetical protein
MTTMAHYYRCLPVLSRMLDSALLSSPSLVDDLARLDLLETAAKLRDKLLFKECLKLALGMLLNPEI